MRFIKQLSQVNQCPAGTIGDEIELIREEQCTPCPEGKYCSTAGESVVTGDCDAGFVDLLTVQSTQRLRKYVSVEFMGDTTKNPTAVQNEQISNQDIFWVYL